MALITRQAQLAGQAALLRFGKLNPLGTNLAIGPVITLLALHYGANDLQTGLLYAGMNLSGIVVLVTPYLCGGIDASRVFFAAWFSRAVLGMAYLALPFLSGNQTKIWLVILVFYGFMAVRAIGVSASQVVTKAISRPTDLAEVVSRQFVWWHIGSIAISLVMAGILNRSAWFPTQEWAYFAILTLGVLFNFATAQPLRQLPPTGLLPKSSPGSLLGGVPAVLRDPERREVVWLSLFMVPMGVAAGYQLNYLKVVLGLSADVVFMTTIGGMLAMLLGSHVAGIIGRSIGFRPLQFGAHALLAVCGAAMAWNEALPVPFRTVSAIVTFIVASLCMSVSSTVLSALSIDRLGETRRLETSVIFQLTATLAAGVGLVVLELSKRISHPGIIWGHPYSHAFLLWALFSLAICWVSQRLRRPGDDAWGDIAVFNPANLLTAVRLHQVDHSKDPLNERMFNLENVLIQRTFVSRARVINSLHSPDMANRLSAYRSLCFDPLPGIAPVVLREALDPHSPLRGAAISALGFLGERSVVSALRPLLDHESPRLAATTFKTLMRLGERLPEESVLAYWQAWPDPADRAEALLGLSATGQIQRLWDVIRLELARNCPGPALRMVLLNLADALGERAEMCEIWSAEEQAPGKGHAFVLGELGDQPELSDLAEPGPDPVAWRAKVSERLKCPAIPDDSTAVSLIFLLALTRNKERRHQTG